MKAYYKDKSGNAHMDWYPKDQLSLLASGSKLIEQELPEVCGEEVKPTRLEKEVRADEMRDCSQSGLSSEKVLKEACRLRNESACPQERKV